MRNGFTIMEVIIVVAIIAFVGILSAPFGIQFYNNQMINSVQSSFVDTLNRARSQSAFQKGDLYYGIYINNIPATTTSFIFFGTADVDPMGDNFSSSDESIQDEYLALEGMTITLPGSEDASSTEIIFSKHTGTPIFNATTSSSGTIYIRWNDLERQILINSFGMISEI